MECRSRFTALSLPVKSLTMDAPSMKSLSALLLLVSSLLAPAPAAAAAVAKQEQVVRFATAEWPPYLGEQLPEQGALAVLLSQAFAGEGYRVELQFFPWARTLLLVRDPASGFDGYVVDYFSEQVARDYLLSQPVATSPLVLAERAGNPLGWQTESDLARYRLGLVTGYINTAEIDRRVANGEIRVEFVSDDLGNLRILAAGRIDAAVIDSRVLAWLGREDRQLREGGEILRVAGGRVLEEKALYACFRRGDRGEQLRAALNRGLKKVDARKVIEQYLQRQLRGSSR
ncbi:MAG: substrate-binding periplasmic protein [Gammaproteobacteria bacterium]